MNMTLDMMFLQVTVLEAPPLSGPRLSRVEKEREKVFTVRYRWYLDRQKVIVCVDVAMG